MNLTEQQKELLRKMVEVYTGGCHDPFIFSETLANGAALVYSGRPSITVDASKSDVLRLRDEDLVDCTMNSGGALRGKPSANGIVLVQRNFSEEIPVLPDIKPESIVMSQFVHILDEDLANEDAVNILMARMLDTPEVAVYFFQRNDAPPNPSLQAAFMRGDILDVIYERLYYKHPSSQRDFVKIVGAEIGQFNWEWERAVVEKGPEYVRRTLKLAERKRREMESLEKIHLEMAYRQKIWEDQNRSQVFLSYASQDHEEAGRIQQAIAVYLSAECLWNPRLLQLERQVNLRVNRLKSTAERREQRAPEIDGLLRLFDGMRMELRSLVPASAFWGA